MNPFEEFLSGAFDAYSNSAKFIASEAGKTLQIDYKGASDLVTHVGRCFRKDDPPAY